MDDDNVVDFLACPKCGAMVQDTYVSTHKNWHEALLYFANTIVVESGMAGDLLKYSSQL